MKKLVSAFYQTSSNQMREIIFFKNKKHRDELVGIARKYGGKIICRSKTKLIYQLPPKQ